MPSVPVSQGNSVRLAPRPVGAVQPVQLDNALGEGLQQAGQSISRFAEVQNEIGIVHDNAAAKLLYNDADNQVRSLLRTGEGAFYTKQGFDAVGARKPTEEAIAKIRADTIAKAKSPRQALAFGTAFDGRIAPELDGIANYANTQNRVEEARQSDARLTNAANDALAHADNPEVFGNLVATGIGELTSQAKANGISGDVLKMQVAKYVSGIHSSVVDSKMVADPVEASVYLDTHRGDMLPEDRTKLRASLHGPMVERAGYAAADVVLRDMVGATPATPTATIAGPLSGRMIAITAHSESRNRDYTASGALITSPKGAQGKMQTMPGTQTDPGFGVRPAADNTVEEKNRVGRDYLAAMMKRYAGDPAKAWAAYNAGPGNAAKGTGLAGGMARAVKAGQPDNWLAFMPKETQDYVRQNVGMLNGKGVTGPSEAAPAGTDLGAAMSRLDALNLPFDVRKAAQAEIERRVSFGDRLKSRAESDAKDGAYKVIDQLGDGFTSINQIPADVRRNLSPEVTHSLNEQAKQNAVPKEVKPNGDAIINLHQLAYVDPEKFKATDLRTLRPYMSRSEYDSIATQQAQMIAKPSSDTQVTHSQIWRTINFYGRDIGIDMSDRKKTENEDAFKARRQDGMKLFTVVKNYLDTLTQGKRTPTDDELKKAYDNAIIQRARADGTVGPRYQDSSLPTNSVAVPTAEFSRIQAYLRGSGQPSDPQSVSRWDPSNKR